MIRQIFIGQGESLAGHPDAHARFERKLYVIRKRVARAVAGQSLLEEHLFYVASLSSNTIVYKGMLIADQVETMFPDLTDPRVESALAPRTPAVLNQHVPLVAARPSVSLHRPQRGDQHVARQHQLDAGPRGAVPIGPVRRGPPEAVSDHSGRSERHRDIRQRPWNSWCSRAGR